MVCAAVKNHGIDEQVVAKQFQASRDFFDLPTDKKETIKVNRWNRGYTPMSDETLDPENQKSADTKEGYNIDREIPPDSKENELPLHGPNQWIAEVSCNIGSLLAWSYTESTVAETHYPRA